MSLTVNDLYQLYLNYQFVIFVYLAMPFRPFDFITPKTLNYSTFQSFEFERTWWRLFHNRAVWAEFDTYVFIREVVLQLTVLASYIAGSLLLFTNRAVVLIRIILTFLTYVFLTIHYYLQRNEDWKCHFRKGN